MCSADQVLNRDELMVSFSGWQSRPRNFGVFRGFASAVSRTGLLSIGMLLFNAAVQVVNFILIARAIGPAGYGVVVAVAAVVTVSVELVGLGCGDMLTRTVVREAGKLRLAFGNALALVLLTFPLVLAGAALVLWLLMAEAGWLAIGLWLLFAELVSARALALAEHVAIAMRQAVLASIFRVGFSLLRLAVVLVATLGLGVQDLAGWWVWQGWFGVLAGPLVLGAAALRFGTPVFNLRTFDLGIGALFAANQVVRALQFNVDRLVMAPVLGAAGLGVYGSGARLTQFALIPVQALLRVSYPQFHEEGQRGIGAARGQAHRVLPGLLVAALLPAGAVWVLAPVVAALMGPGFEGVVDVLRGLAPLPVAMAVQYVYGDVLSGADRQGWRTGISVVSTLMLAGAIWIGSQAGGLIGGIQAVVVGNVLVAMAYVGIVEWLNRRAG